LSTRYVITQKDNNQWYVYDGDSLLYKTASQLEATEIYNKLMKQEREQTFTIARWEHG
tara:strand:- start:236 stop:409 length:174 start_codon:yes stop_codon:yes gene_type:complete